MSHRVELTQARVKQLLDYDAASGHFTWKVDRRRVKAGTQAGGICSNGYWRIRVDGVRYRSHRLVWLWTQGVFPAECLDHINGDPLDNRITNLRPATVGENRQNLPIYKNNTSGFPGVTPVGKDKWQARIRINNRRIYLGRHSSREAAVSAYLAAKASMHTFNPTVRNR